MGIADSIPGVSGGTMALIMGIYPRLIDAIGSLGLGSLKRVITRGFWSRVVLGLRHPSSLDDGEEDEDARRLLFLAFLGVGMAAAIVLGARIIPSLLDRYPAEMKALFFGLVLSSVTVPLRMIGRPTWKDYGVLVAAGIMTWLLLGGTTSTDHNAQGRVEIVLAGPAGGEMVLDPARFFVAAPGSDGAPDVVFAPYRPVRFEPGQVSATVPVLARMAGEWGNLAAGSIVSAHGAPVGTRVIQSEATTGGMEPSRISLFIAGFVAISAMVLPGISGSFILLLFGLYHYVTHALRMALFHGDPGAWITVLIVLLAIGTGLLTITRIVKQLLERARRPTLAALSGLMVGSLRLLWPFTQIGDDGVPRNVLPTQWDATVGVVFLTFLAGVAAVLLLERAGRNRSKETPAQA